MPPPGAIEPGVICRVEAYGAFCQLTNFGCRGLIHISQLANYKVEKVEDVLSVDDQVWVKVLSVEEDTTSQQQGRFKVSLSLKDASQDGTGQDLGAQREQQDFMSSQIEQNLNSSIGMAVARDPMEDRLIMKHKGSIFNGYSLVGEDEGEPERAAVVPTPQSETRLAPVGRGRGATLPAWMTKAPDGPTGADSGDDGSKRKKRKEKKKKEHTHSHSGSKHRRRHRHDGSDSEDSEDSYRKRHRKRRKRSRSHDREKRSHDKDRKDKKRDRKDGDVSEASGDDNNKTDRKRKTETSGADRNKSSRRRREGRSHSREGRGERKTRDDGPDRSGEHRHGRKHRRGRSESDSNDSNSLNIGRKRSRSRERGNDVKRGSLKEKGSTPTVL
jgi:predicted RNA-binding protein with RPS1 domain